MYNEQLENLIEMALLDGELTEKEKQILFKKAESLGLDLDEFEMVLEAKLFEKNKNKAPDPVAAPKSNKLGDIKKCPACGAIVQSFSGKCGDCGYEFRDIQSDSTITKLFDALMEADNIPKEEFRETRLSGVMKLLHDPREDAKRLRKHEQAHKDKIHSRKVQIISNFPVPNSKEALLEFMSLGLAHAMPVKKSLFGKLTAADEEHNAFAPVWKAKMEQIAMKIRISMKEDKSLVAEAESIMLKLNSK